MTCAKCGRAVPEGSRFCLNCGTPLNIGTAETVLDTGETVLDVTPGPNRAVTPPAIPAPRTPAPSGAPPADSVRRGDTSRSPTISTSTWSRGSRFAPGTMLAGRYRIVAKLGRGGMGEVYRAEDLTLDQEVALKFLPPELASDPAALARFHAEVRLARQVSHPNVCRVFDIGMADGAPFITMEYVDGEDLASLIRRVGRFPQDKGLEIARQICAGLAAAHEQGLLHRDLKPANIMLDGRGRIRIADFGLASVAGEAQGTDSRSGTPAYMAPEQLAGGEPTVKSDIYSLGLVLYEIFTGKRAYDATTITDLQKQRSAAAPTTPTTLVKELDPIVERVILRCIEKDPAKRPGSPLQVAAALPGGDPLAAALAAGETPSPAMVAAAGSTEASSPAYVWSCIGIVILAVVLEFALSGRARLLDTAGVPQSPDVLTARAGEMLRQFGYTEKPGSTANGFDTDVNYLNWIDKNDESDSKWNRADTAIDFWYRQAPNDFEQRQILGTLTQGRVNSTDPPMEDPGMIRIDLDPAGHMTYLRVVTQRKVADASQAKPVNWDQVLRDAGFDPEQCKSVAAVRNPPDYADAVTAWTAQMPERPEVTLHIDAAAYAGRPSYFVESGPWTPAPGTTANDRSQQVAIVFALLVLGGMLILGSVRAWQNMKQERADMRGAFRLAGLMFSLEVATWVVGASHEAKLWEGYSLTLALAWASLAALFLWMIYIALEPFLRRRMPTIMIAWTRFISGQFQDPLVGRSVLAGVAVASLTRIIDRGDILYSVLKRLPPPSPTIASPLLASTGPSAFAEILSVVATSIFSGFALVCVFVILRRILGNQWIAAAAFIAVWTGRGVLSGGQTPVDVVLSVVALSLLVLLLMQYGLLAVMVEILVENLYALPITLQGSVWYAWIGWLGVAVIAALVIYSSRIALAGRPFLGKVAFAEQ